MIKKISFYIIAILISSFAFSQTIPFGKGYVINGEIKGESRGFVTLRSYFRDGNERVDTAFIENGKFSFRSPISEIIPAQLSVNGMRDWRIYLEPTTYTISINPNKASEFFIKGSNTTDYWYKVTNAEAKEDYYVHLNRLENWILNNPEHIFCSDIITSFLSFKWGYTELNKTLNTLKKPASQTYHYIKLRERENQLKRLEVGNRAPDFTMSSSRGGTINLFNYSKGKKFILIDFWASWCKPCREENPNLVEAHQKFKNKGFDIIGVSLDKDANAWQKAIKDDNLNWAHVSDLKMWENSVAKTYMINSIPSNVLIDDKGIIIARNLKGVELIDKLNELTNTYGFEIKGNIAGVEQGKVTLNLLLENGVKQKLETEIAYGDFVFNGVVKDICMAQIILPRNAGEFSFFMENNKIEIKGDKANIEAVDIKGSPYHDRFKSMVDACNRSKNPLQALTDEILKRPNTYYAPLLISNYLAPYISDIELRKAFESLHGDALKMFQYKLLEEYIIEMDKKEGIGEKAIDFILADVNGIDVKMYDLIKDKKYVLIDFWASWCVPCRNESKYLTQAYYKFNKKGFDILGVSLDKDRENWIKAIRNDGLIWTNVSDLRQWNSIIVKLYNLEAIPYNIIVDSKGNIIARNVRGENLITTLNQLFSE